MALTAFLGSQDDLQHMIPGFTEVVCSQLTGGFDLTRVTWSAVHLFLDNRYEHGQCVSVLECEAQLQLRSDPLITGEECQSRIKAAELHG